jgi:hypothetical protein
MKLVQRSTLTRRRDSGKMNGRSDDTNTAVVEKHDGRRGEEKETQSRVTARSMKARTAYTPECAATEAVNGKRQKLSGQSKQDIFIARDAAMGRDRSSTGLRRAALKKTINATRQQQYTKDCVPELVEGARRSGQPNQIGVMIRLWHAVSARAPVEGGASTSPIFTRGCCCTSKNGLQPRVSVHSTQ